MRKRRNTQDYLSALSPRHLREYRNQDARGRVANLAAAKRLTALRVSHPRAETIPGVVSSPDRLGYFVTVSVVVLDLTVSCFRFCHMGLMPRATRMAYSPGFNV